MVRAELEEELEKDAERQKQLTVCIEQLQSELLEVKVGPVSRAEGPAEGREGRPSTARL
jgi:hypothetical protein